MSADSDFTSMPARAPLAEALLLMTVVLMRYHEQSNPARVLRWLFGTLPSRRFDVLEPWLGLLLGIGNILLVALLLCLFVRSPRAEWVRRIAVAWFIAVLGVMPVLDQIEVRFHIDEAPGNTALYRSSTHDGGVAQTEMASTELLHGRNPYTARYDRPPMSRTRDSAPAAWQALGYTHNPAFDHLPYPPGILWINTPLQALSNAIFHRWDTRLLYLLMAFALAFTMGTLVPRGPPRRMVWMGVLLNPLLHRYVVAGRNDVVLLLPLAWFALCTLQQRWIAASVALGIALLFKQFAVCLVPFFALLVWYTQGSLRQASRALWPAVVIPLVGSLPFLLWAPGAFLRNVVFWNLGAAGVPYPLRWGGFGITPLAYGLDLVHAPTGSNPLGWLGLLVIVGAFGFLVRVVRKEPTPQLALVAGAVWLWVVLFASRAFLLNYPAGPATVLAVVALWHTQINGPKNSGNVS